MFNRKSNFKKFAWTFVGGVVTREQNRCAVFRERRVMSQKELICHIEAPHTRSLQIRHPPNREFVR